MIKRNNKKGFTIVELVIVIAVIAILAAVLIPTFAGIINKANQSADMQAVRQMNTLLAMEDVNKPQSISEAKTVLLASNIDMQDYKPLAKNMYFYWVKSLNRVLYVNADNTVKYPEEYAAETYAMGDWYSLSGEVVQDDAWKEKVNNNTASIASGEELVSLMTEYSNNSADAKAITTITLTEDIDLKGSAANFAKITGNFTIEGNGKTIYGVNSNESVSNGDNASGNSSSYAYGLFGKIENATVVLKNVVISGAVIDDPENPAQVGHAGIIAGSVGKNGYLTLENVTIENSFVRGEKKVGALVGYVQNNAVEGCINLTNVVIKNTIVTGAREVASLFGYVQNPTAIVGGATVTADNLSVIVDNSYGWTYENDNALASHPDEDAKKAGVTTKDFWNAAGVSSTNAVATDFN